MFCASVGSYEYPFHFITSLKFSRLFFLRNAKKKISSDFLTTSIKCRWSKKYGVTYDDTSWDKASLSSTVFHLAKGHFCIDVSGSVLYKVSSVRCYNSSKIFVPINLFQNVAIYLVLHWGIYLLEIPSFPFLYNSLLTLVLTVHNNSHAGLYWCCSYESNGKLLNTTIAST